MNSRLLSEVALAFADHEEFGMQLSRALKSLCEGLQLSRAYLYIDGQKRDTMGYTHEWCAEGVEQQWLEAVPYESYAAWTRMLTEAGSIVCSDASQLPDDLAALLRPFGIDALQAYPIEFEHQMVGFIGFDAKGRSWSDEESGVMRAASVIISALSEREILREHVRIAFESTDKLATEEDDAHSIYDPLTGSYNRRYVFDRLAGFDAEYARLGRNFCISLLEIDQFYAINDRYGTEAGNFILKEFASVLGNSIRPYDLSGRYGNEEFIIVSVNASALETGYLIERIRNAVRNHAFSFNGTEIHPVFNYGIADSSEFLPESLSIEDMAALASQRLSSSRVVEDNLELLALQTTEGIQEQNTQPQQN